MTRLRYETPEDETAIAALVTAAFLTAPHADGNEAEIVARLRGADGLLLSLVAEDVGLVGHVSASPATVAGRPGWAAIAPVSVAPQFQGRGIGSALVRAALARLGATGASGAVLVGDPGYYGLFGFAARDGLTAAGIPSEYVLALPFGAVEPQGAILFHPAFDLA